MSQRVERLAGMEVGKVVTGFLGRPGDVARALLVEGGTGAVFGVSAVRANRPARVWDAGAAGAASAVLSALGVLPFAILSAFYSEVNSV